MSETKRCSRCKQSKPISEFNKAGGEKDGLRFDCRECQRKAGREQWRRSGRDAKRAKRLNQLYGLTERQYADRVEAQKGLCAICRKPETFVREGTSTTWRLSVDHDHVTGAVRQLLCKGCNRGLSMFRDDPDVLTAAARYIRVHKANRGGSGLSHDT